ncbi:MAG: SAM-dependent methyltransferase [Phycisphaerales bacterium]
MPQPRKLHDEYFKKAKSEGYVARSAYKLTEINEKKFLVKKGRYVLDCGCAPGSWLQVVEEIIGPDGLALGIDLQDVRTEFGPTVKVLKEDVFAFDPTPYIEHMGRQFDVVLSDMAPNTSGHGDDFLSVRLCRRVLDLLPKVLRPGGHLCMKVLEGEEFPALLRQTRALFRDGGALKPRASREISRETFIWAKGYTGPSEAPGNQA